MEDLIEWKVQVGDVETRAVLERAERPGNVIILGHGAGSHRDHPLLLKVSRIFGGVGLSTVRFNFLYRELQKGGLDRMPRLMECYRAVADSVRERYAPERLLLGGHSMGGRTASMLAADGYRCSGLILLGYPLHPAGQPDKLRDAHLHKIQDPVLCFNGTRDDLCQKELMERATAGLPGWTMRWIEGADYSFKVQKRSGRTPEDVLEEIGGVSQRWVQESIVPYHGSESRPDDLPEGGAGPGGN